MFPISSLEVTLYVGQATGLDAEKNDIPPYREFFEKLLRPVIEWMNPEAHVVFPVIATHWQEQLIHFRITPDLKNKKVVSPEEAEQIAKEIASKVEQCQITRWGIVTVAVQVINISFVSR